MKFIVKVTVVIILSDPSFTTEMPDSQRYRPFKPLDIVVFLAKCSLIKDYLAEYKTLRM